MKVGLRWRTIQTAISGELAYDIIGFDKEKTEKSQTSLGLTVLITSGGCWEGGSL